MSTGTVPRLDVDTEALNRLTIKLQRLLSSVWVLRALYAYVPRPSASMPVPQDGIQSGEYLRIYEMRSSLISWWGALSASFSFSIPAALILSTVSYEEYRNMRFVATSLILSVICVVSAVRLIKAYRNMPGNTVFASVAARTIVARKGIHASPAAWILDPRMWEYVYGPIVERRPSAEQDVIITLAEEWNGTAGELFEAAPVLVGSSKK